MQENLEQLTWARTRRGTHDIVLKDTLLYSHCRTRKDLMKPAFTEFLHVFSNA